MTTKTIAHPTTTTNTNGLLKASDALKTNGAALAQFPEFPPRYDMQNIDILHEIGYVPTLKRHFGARDTTLVYGEVPIGTTLSVRLGLRIPDLIIAFDCDPERAIERQGYDITEQGKPPDFVMEIASKTTGRVDYTEKRVDYERYGIPEYWRFDATGGDYHDAALAGDRLVDGHYEPILIERMDGGVRGYSETLGLYVCWSDGDLLWYDPRTDSYLLTSDEEADRADRAEERAAREAAERQLAEERVVREAARAGRESEARRRADERAEQEAVARRQADERAEQEAARANRAEAELRRIRERLGRLDDDE